MNALKAIRNNWKKSVFFAGVLAYGGNYGYNKYRIHQLMRTVCAEALIYGNELLPANANCRHVIVVLNPTANKRSAESSFEKYCAPILHLSGIRVDVVRTESEGFARSYISDLQELPDAIVVAGGDGTLSEVVTGLIRRTGGLNACPIGVLPVGRTNSVARRMFPSGSGPIEEVEALSKAAMSIVRGRITQKDVMKIEVLPEPDSPAAEQDESMKKPIYALASIKWGAFRDAISLQDKYWYYGGARAKAAILFNSFRSTLNWNCTGQVVTTPPCSGCSECYEKKSSAPEYKGRNWWSFLVPKSRKSDSDYMVNGQDVRALKNPECSVETEITLKDASELFISTSNLEVTQDSETTSILNLRLGPANVNTMDWIQDSWKRTTATKELNSTQLSSPIAARTVRLVPEQKQSEKEEFYSIDNEDFEVKPIRITLLPKHINVFTL